MSAADPIISAMAVGLAFVSSGDRTD